MEGEGEEREGWREKKEERERGWEDYLDTHTHTHTHTHTGIHW